MSSLSAQTAPTHVAPVQRFGNTQVPVTLQVPAVKHAAPPTLHVPAPHVESSVQLMDGLCEHVPVHCVFAVHVLPEAAQVPGLHLFDAHEALLVHACPVSWSAVQVGAVAARSQNNPVWHCAVAAQAWPEDSSGAHMPTLQNNPDAHPVPQGWPLRGFGVHACDTGHVLSAPHS